jgi:hypothetical protein
MSNYPELLKNKKVLGGKALMKLKKYDVLRVSFMDLEVCYIKDFLFLTLNYHPSLYCNSGFRCNHFYILNYTL